MDAPNTTNSAASAAEQDPRAALLILTDGTFQTSGLDPEAQAGVLMAACALAVRRIMEAHDTHDTERNRVLRHKLRKAAVGEFESKLRKYCSPVTAR
ncbi:hypothetical protein JQ608_06915 [Bradyrhizobium liaoningense]|uniref:hypothetical protein n=1 Tax=Bradyrhizobium liaoningense TaxID=43992 RepID=UPI001BA8CD15|nr:hypothetical protein [Bradyrhizobium liaoningense]MBR0876933.1 hypothetical protein [Bradyrhizobium liaoningense]